jgi:hypothetical protein
MQVLLIRDRNMSITSLFFQNIVSRCGGKIIIIDTGKKNSFVRMTKNNILTLYSPGISHAYGGALSALSIYYTLTPIGDDASQRWREKEVVSALYHDRREVLAIEERELVGNFLHDDFDEDEVYI